MNSLVRALALASAAMTISSAASAELISFDFSGVYDSGARVGQGFSGTLTYDTTASVIDADSGPGFAFKTYGSALVLSNASNLVISSASSTRTVTVFDSSLDPYLDGIDFDVSSGSSSFRVELLGSRTAFSGTAAPSLATLLSNSLYQRRYFSNIGGGIINVAPAAVVSSVPEPATWGMMLLGFGGLGYSMRRRHKVSPRIRFAQEQATRP